MAVKRPPTIDTTSGTTIAIKLGGRTFLSPSAPCVRPSPTTSDTEIKLSVREMTHIQRRGLALKKVLDGKSPDEHVPFLAYLERKAKYSGEADIREYRRMVAG